MDKNERDFAPMEENTLGTFRDASYEKIGIEVYLFF